MWHDANNDNASANRFPVDSINDEAAEDINLQIPPLLPLGIVCKSTLEIMFVVAVILTIS